MIVSATGPSALASAPLRTVPSFRSWQRDTIARGLLPVIGVVGGRGKSTVVRMLDLIFRQAHLRTATWTNLGVEIRGRRQRGELSAWSLALSRLSESSIDVAIQELHWSTINAVGLPRHSYPVMVMTNLHGSLDAPGSSDEARDAVRAVRKAASAVHPGGLLMSTADDPALSAAIAQCDGSVILSSLSRESPAIRQHLDANGVGIWHEDGVARAGSRDDVHDVFAPESIPATLRGAAPQQVSNALVAASVALSLGIDVETAEAALVGFESDADLLPGSMNVFEIGASRAVVDRVCPSWHLRALLRAVNPARRHRLLSVVGHLETLPLDDVHEVGRLIGRYPGAVISYTETNGDHLDRFKRGVAANDYPPLVITLPTERRALNRALKTARPEDLLLVLTGDDPGVAIRAIRRQLDAVA